MYYPHHDMNGDEDLLSDQDDGFPEEFVAKNVNPFTSKDESILKKLDKLNAYIYYATGKRFNDDDFFEETLEKINEAFDILYRQMTKVETNKKHPLYP